MSAAVEKLAGRISIIVIKTGNQRSINDDLKVISISRFRAKYLATKTIKTTDATVDV